jgi:hypothetical protein
MSLTSGTYDLTTYPWAKAQGQLGRQAFSPLFRYGQWAALIVTSAWLGFSVAEVEPVMLFGRPTPLIVGVVGFSILFFISRMWRSAYDRMINASAFRAGTWRMEIAEDGLHLNSETVRQVFAWRTISEVRDGPNGMLVMMGPVLFLPVPRYAFPDDRDAAAFRQALEARIAMGAT